MSNLTQMSVLKASIIPSQNGKSKVTSFGSSFKFSLECNLFSSVKNFYIVMQFLRKHGQSESVPVPVSNIFQIYYNIYI